MRECMADHLCHTQSQNVSTKREPTIPHNDIKQSRRENTKKNYWKMMVCKSKRNIAIACYLAMYLYLPRCELNHPEIGECKACPTTTWNQSAGGRWADPTTARTQSSGGCWRHVLPQYKLNYLEDAMLTLPQYEVNRLEGWYTLRLVTKIYPCFAH